MIKEDKTPENKNILPRIASVPVVRHPVLTPRQFNHHEIRTGHHHHHHLLHAAGQTKSISMIAEGDLMRRGFPPRAPKDTIVATIDDDRKRKDAASDERRKRRGIKR